jgi:hypothetical protein
MLMRQYGQAGGAGPANGRSSPQIDPRSGDLGLTSGQYGHCRLVTMQPLGSKYMRLDTLELQHRTAGADLEQR